MGSSNLARFMKFLLGVSFRKDDPYRILVPTKLIFIVGRRRGSLQCNLRYITCGIPMLRRAVTDTFETKSGKNATKNCIPKWCILL
jgi:hypothetical protein